MDSVPFTELLPGLPEELAVECLTRLHYSAHSVASLVCKRWRELILSRRFYYHRKKTGRTLKAACFVQAFPIPSHSKPIGQPCYGISMLDPVSRIWNWVEPIPNYPNGLPMFCEIVSSEGKLAAIGGWDPANWEPVRDMFVYDFATRAWTQCADMPSKRSFFAAGAVDGSVFVAGGHDESKNALKSAWAFDMRRNEWSELGALSEERDECEGVVIGSEFWVVSGYGTETQGRFKSSAESLELSTGAWRRVEDAWVASRCPRGCVGKAENGNLICWADRDPEIRVGACGVVLGEVTILTGSAFQGGPQGFFIRGVNGNLEKIEVPIEFQGFVQSGCTVEI